MKHSYRLIFYTFFWLSTFTVAAQDTLFLQEYYQLVRDHHPLSIQADLITTRGDLVVSEARGAFDPKVISQYQQKEFRGSKYYQIWDSYLQIPTFLNVDLKAGYERADGVFLNPERNLPEDGLYYAGISVPIGQGLIRNPKAMALKRSKLESKDLQLQANLTLNNLLLQANRVYWNWYEAYNKFNIVQSNFSLIDQRFKGVRESVLAGENAAIDSVEALIQLQEWDNRLQKTTVDYRNSLLMLKSFLWGSTISDEFIPVVDPPMELGMLENYQEQALSNLPQWKTLQVQQAKLKLEKQLSAERIKPKININYNLLLASENEGAAAGLTNNYQGGFEVEFPLFLRKERSSLKQAKIKLQENDLKQADMLRKMQNNVAQYYHRLMALRSMIEQQQQMILNYQRMLTGERIKFRNGESSIFLINNRENQKLNAELRLIELKTEYGTLRGLLLWSSGILWKKQPDQDL